MNVCISPLDCSHTDMDAPTLTEADQWKELAFQSVRALDTAIFSFARWQTSEDMPTWFLDGSKAFK